MQWVPEREKKKLPHPRLGNRARGEAGSGKKRKDFGHVSSTFHISLPSFFPSIYLSSIFHISFHHLLYFFPFIFGIIFVLAMCKSLSMGELCFPGSSLLHGSMSSICPSSKRRAKIRRFPTHHVFRDEVKTLFLPETRARATSAAPAASPRR